MGRIIRSPFLTIIAMIISTILLIVGFLNILLNAYSSIFSTVAYSLFLVIVIILLSIMAFSNRIIYFDDFLIIQIYRLKHDLKYKDILSISKGYIAGSYLLTDVAKRQYLISQPFCKSKILKMTEVIQKENPELIVCL